VIVKAEVPLSDSNRHRHSLIYGRGRTDLKGLGRARVPRGPGFCGGGWGCSISPSTRNTRQATEGQGERPKVNPRLAGVLVLGAVCVELLGKRALLAGLRGLQARERFPLEIGVAATAATNLLPAPNTVRINKPVLRNGIEERSGGVLPSVYAYPLNESDA
jgi:hypothetical protein